jgi:heme exporter protein C
MQKKYLKWGYKGLAASLVSYTLVAGLTNPLPELPLLEQSARAVFYHIPLWIAMYVMLAVAVVYSIRYLRNDQSDWDVYANEAAKVAIFFGFLGLFTGMIWSRVSWNAALPDADPAAWWPSDPKNNMALVALLVIVAYLVLRSSLEDARTRARLGAVYLIFAFVAVIALTYVIPRTMQSLHPGSDTTQLQDTSFGPEYRLILYPAFLGTVLMAVWILEVRIRIRKATQAIHSYIENQ